MHEESKKTIDWIKKVLKDGETRHSIEESDYEANEQSAINLLDKIENLEKYLQHGGLIQDCAGAWCKVGDHITVYKEDDNYDGILEWNREERTFYLRNDSNKISLGKDSFVYDKYYDNEK